MIVMCVASLKGDDKTIFVGLNPASMAYIQSDKALIIDRKNHGSAVPSGLKIVLCFAESDQLMLDIMRERGWLDGAKTECTHTPAGQPPCDFCKANGIGGS